MRSGLMRATSRSLTACARSCERCQLEGKRIERIGWLSVWPVTSIWPGWRCSSSAMRSNSGNTFAVTSALPGPKMPSPRITITERSVRSRTSTSPASISALRNPDSRGTAAAGGGGGGGGNAAALTSSACKAVKVSLLWLAISMRMATKTTASSNAAAVAATHTGMPSRRRAAATGTPAQCGDSSAGAVPLCSRSISASFSRTASSCDRPS